MHVINKYSFEIIITKATLVKLTPPSRTTRYTGIHK